MMNKSHHQLEQLRLELFILLYEKIEVLFPFLRFKLDKLLLFKNTNAILAQELKSISII